MAEARTLIGGTLEITKVDGSVIQLKLLVDGDDLLASIGVDAVRIPMATVIQVAQSLISGRIVNG